MDTIVIQDNDTTISLNPSTIVAGAIGSVNGQMGEVHLTAADVGADAAGAADAVRLELVAQIASKAAQVDVDTLADQVKTKADAADLTTLTDALATKANAAALADYTKKSDFQVTKNLAEVNNLNIGLKADQADLDATDQQVADIQQTLLTKADVAALTVLTQLVNTKADQSYVISEIARITGNAPAALDTLSEIAAQLGKDESQIQTLLDAVGNRVRYDAAQSLSVSQQQQARDNIGAEAKGVAQALVSGVTVASIGAATAAQGAKADTALQSGDVAPVALSGSFSSLSNQNKIFDVVYSAYQSVTAAAISASDTLGQIVSKLQAQLNSHTASINVNATAIATKEPVIATGTASQYWRGDKTWQALSSIFGLVNSGYAVGTATPISNTDTLNQQLGKLQGQISGNKIDINNLYSRTAVTVGGKNYLAGRYYDASYGLQSAFQDLTPSLKTVYAIPFCAADSVTITRLAVSVSSVGNGLGFQLALYNSDTSNYPATQLVKLSLTASATGEIGSSCSQPLVKGQVYWLVFLSVDSTAVIQGYARTYMRPILGPTTSRDASTNFLILGQTTDLPASLIGSGWIENSTNICPRICFTVA